MMKSHLGERFPTILDVKNMDQRSAEHILRLLIREADKKDILISEINSMLAEIMRHAKRKKRQWLKQFAWSKKVFDKTGMDWTVFELTASQSIMGLEFIHMHHYAGEMQKVAGTSLISHSKRNCKSCGRQGIKRGRTRPSNRDQN